MVYAGDFAGMFVRFMCILIDCAYGEEVLELWCGYGAVAGGDVEGVWRRCRICGEKVRFLLSCLVRGISA